MTGLYLRQSAPNAAQLSNLVEMGDSLAAACAELARDPSPERCDQLIHRLNGAEAGVRQFRRQLHADQEAGRDPD